MRLAILMCLAALLACASAPKPKECKESLRWDEAKYDECPKEGQNK